MLSANKQFWCALPFIFCSIAISKAAIADRLEPDLFGLIQQANYDVAVFPQMGSVTRRYHTENKTPCREYETDSCLTKVWRKLLLQWQAYNGRELLEQLNAAINTFDYRPDEHNYSREDYWATPNELVKNGGDCEDFAVAKMLALQHLGVSPESMRIVVLQNTATAQPHAVLAVQDGQETLILDNKIDTLFSDNELPHYVPLYSINQQQWWLHLPLEVAERLFVQTASTTGRNAQISGAVVSR